MIQARLSVSMKKALLAKIILLFSGTFLAILRIERFAGNRSFAGANERTYFKREWLLTRYAGSICPNCSDV